jgi:NAD(P)H-hydrate repair Nnr-like enzyme with NAD(P)H-hydrate epimerase domain
MALVKQTLIDALKSAGFSDAAAGNVANAIDAYIKSQTITVPSGIAVQVTPATGTGATISPTTATIG